MEFRGKKYSVPFALPGDLVQFKILRKGRKSKFQVVHIEPSEEKPEGIALSEEPGCKHSGLCGGCRARHLDYDFQWEWKSRPIRQKMKEKYGLDPELLGAPALEHFRNRMDYAVEGTGIGLRPPQDFQTVLDLEECPVLRQPGEDILKIFRGLLVRYPSLGRNRETESGWLKYVTVRLGKRSGVVVLTTSGEQEGISAFLQELQEELSGLAAQNGFSLSLVETVTEDKQELSCTPGGRAVLGSPHYQDELAGEVFDVPYDSFFQPNPDAFGLLLDKILEAAEPFIHEVGSEGQGEQSNRKKEGSLVDLYCGAGILSRIVARRWPYLRHIKGYEFVQSAVDQATKLFSEAGLEASFEAVDLNQPGSLELNSDLLIADPPRAGLSPGLCQEIARAKPAKYMIYISCNPETQLRDLDILSQSYNPRAAILADCFPYTAHMEQAILLTSQTSQDRN